MIYEETNVLPLPDTSRERSGFYHLDKSIFPADFCRQVESRGISADRSAGSFRRVAASTLSAPLYCCFHFHPSFLLKHEGPARETSPPGPFFLTCN
jgi:hypothetical protein